MHLQMIFLNIQQHQPVHVQNKHTLVLTLNLTDVRNTLIECERVLILQMHPIQFLSSKKNKLNDKLDYPQSSTARIIGSNFPRAGPS